MSLEKINSRADEAIEKTNLITDKNYEGMHKLNEMDIERMRRHIKEINRKLRSDYDNVYNKFERFVPEGERKEWQT